MSAFLLLQCSETAGRWQPGGHSPLTPWIGPAASEGSRVGAPGAVLRDLILDATGGFAGVEGPSSPPLISTGAHRLTLDQPPPVPGSSPGHPETEEVPTKAESLGDPRDPLGAGPLDLKVDPATGAYTQFATAKLGARRRTQRLVTLGTPIAGDPSSSLPNQTTPWSDLKAADRWWDRPEATFEVLASPHGPLTIEPAQAGRFLILDDTTEIDFGPTRPATGLGPVGRGAGRGFLIHSGLMVTPQDQWILGWAGPILFHRPPAPKGETRAQRRARDRESAVWWQWIEQVGPPPENAQWIPVMDRGADAFEVPCRAQRIGADGISRVQSRHRRVRDEAGTERVGSEVLAEAPVAGGSTLKRRARPQQPARRAQIEVSWAAVTVLVPRPPAASLKALAPPPIAPWAIWARAVDPPSGLKEPIDWWLETALPVRTLEAAMEVISYYEKRWLIEEWHKALKTGCPVESRHLGTSEGLEALTGLLSVVAVRLLQWKEVGRRDPKRAATAWIPAHYVEMVRRARGRVRPEEWTVRDFFRGVAGWGGFLGRKGDGEPGWVTIWRGWEVLHGMLQGARLTAQPNAP
jgi:Transposase DNA-binding/Transposase Tn5 dimerisation domain